MTDIFDDALEITEESVAAQVAANEGRCKGCGEIIHRDDYVRGECRWCGREVGDNERL